MRTKEEVHVCVNQELELDYNDLQLHASPSHSYCHSHEVEYVSNSTPVKADAFSSIRRATIRALSGEQLPRGQTSGPLFFGNHNVGYTAAYVFRLADIYARGRQRYYALLAQLGKDTKRALEASTLIWSSFENIAINIVRTAQEAASRNQAKEGAPASENERIKPMSFLTQRTMDPDGFPRCGVMNIKANGLVDLVDNDRFFCELHVMFVGMLQDLGKILGGLQIQRGEANDVLVTARNDTQCPLGTSDEKIVGCHIEDDELQMSPSELAPQHEGGDLQTISSKPELQHEELAENKLDRCHAPVCAPRMVTQRSQVMV